ncbi:MAG: hypothetical protein Q8P41_31960 [Pseudomonadota bacterium]|nr:hypothetical protein [Pseudomonadota bacterium]
MLTLEQHFASGYLPALIGSYFNLAQLLSQNAASTVSEVRVAVVEEVPRLRQTGEFIKEKVRLVNALAELVGFTPPSPPRVPEEYYPWFEQMHAGFRAPLVTHHRDEVTQLFGNRVGDILCSWNVLILTIRLLIADPGSPVLEQQLVALRDDLKNTADALLITARHPNLPLPLFPLGELVVTAVDELLRLPLTDAGTGELTQAGHRLNERMRELSVAVGLAEGALREVGGIVPDA